MICPHCGQQLPAQRLQPLTHRQAEALWCARQHGSAMALAGNWRTGGRRLFYALGKAGYLNDSFGITDAGREALADFEKHHRKPLAPLTRMSVLTRVRQAN